MTIEQGLHEDFGKNRKYVSVNLSDKKHKNRVLSFFKRKHPLTKKIYYEIKVQWTLEKYHPSMKLSKTELLKLSEALADMARSKSPKRRGKRTKP